MLLEYVRAQGYLQAVREAAALATGSFFPGCQSLWSGQGQLCNCSICREQTGQCSGGTARFIQQTGWGGGKKEAKSCCRICAAELLNLGDKGLTKGLAEVLGRQTNDSLQSQMRSLAGVGGRD